MSDDARLVQEFAELLARADQLRKCAPSSGVHAAAGEIVAKLVDLLERSGIAEILQFRAHVHVLTEASSPSTEYLVPTPRDTLAAAEDRLLADGCAPEPEDDQANRDQMISYIRDLSGLIPKELADRAIRDLFHIQAGEKAPMFLPTVPLSRNHDTLRQRFAKERFLLRCCYEGGLDGWLVIAERTHPVPAGGPTMKKWFRNLMRLPEKAAQLQAAARIGEAERRGEAPSDADLSLVPNMLNVGETLSDLAGAIMEQPRRGTAKR